MSFITFFLRRFTILTNLKYKQVIVIFLNVWKYVHSKFHIYYRTQLIQ